MEFTRLFDLHKLQMWPVVLPLRAPICREVFGRLDDQHRRCSSIESVWDHMCSAPINQSAVSFRKQPA
jgi:hypothetical protein